MKRREYVLVPVAAAPGMAKGDLVTWGKQGKRGTVTSLKETARGVWTARIAYDPGGGLRPTHVTLDSRLVRRVEKEPRRG